MSTTLSDLVSALPEVYQTIYNHPEWDGDASRDCNERLGVISTVYDTLANKLGRPLNVLDLGCAQGFFSLSLASKGASVQGIDFLQENIDVCKALAEEHADFSIRFATGRIEEVIEQLEFEQYDLVIGLSVFHHVVHSHGIAQVQTWLQRLTDSVHAVILELALKEEPLYWGPSQPDDPRELIEQCSFYHQLARFDTHLSDISRPMYLISNDYLIIGDYCQPFSQWSIHPYEEAGLAHKGSRRYYFNAETVCKIYYFSTSRGELLPRESERNRSELEHEAAFLANPPAGFPAPKLLLSGHNDVEGWLVMERFSGKLLMEKIKNGEVIDIDSLLGQVLDQVVILEKHALYHDDLRTWNIMVDDEQNARIIDCGSISPVKQDCVWPGDLFHSFAILINEIITPESVAAGFLRPAALSPFNLPAPYANWLYAFWQQPASERSFALLHALFLKRKTLPAIETGLTSVESWIGAQEKVLMHNQSHIRQIDTMVNGYVDRVGQIEQHLEHSVNKRMETLEQVVLELKQSIVAAELPHVVEEFTPLPQEDLSQRLEEAEHRAAYLAAENARLHEHIQAMMRSRSWRMTSWWRKIGHPVKQMSQQPVGQAGKRVVRRTLASAIGYLNRKPALKNRVFTILRVTGLYNISIKVYQRCFPVTHNDHVVVETSQDDLLISYNDKNQRPPQVEDIYLKLKR